MEKTFKSFIKDEKNKKLMEYKVFILPVYIILSLIYLFWADLNIKEKTKINYLKHYSYIYVNNNQDDYIMNITLNNNDTKDIHLSKDEYLKYKEFYNKGVKSYLYEYTNWFYLIYLIIFIVIIIL